MPKHIGYLIIGQGLAGSLLGWELIKQGCSIHIIDNQKENASQVAAGLINPVTGMRLVKNADIENLLPCAQQTYQALSDFFQQDFYISKDMLRIVRNQKELLKFEQRCQDQSYLDYLVPELQTPPASIQAPLGVIQQKNTGYLLTRKLLNHLKDFFQQKQCYQASQFDYQDLQFAPSISYQDITAKKIIFCEGYQAIHNPWFKYLPFQLSKGEILTLTAEQPLPDKILNYGRWFIPLGNLQFRTGATFTHDQLDTLPTTQGKQLLLQALTQVIPALSSATLIKHQANIRPTTLDKAPFIGLHPEYDNLGIFNGFGAKGSLQIPYYSQQFVQYLLKQSPLAPEADCRRINCRRNF
ncbi:MAG: FAD-dependent oxidoreductase [Methyloprofundus sp.]|nr:FAD-dependent oxidoreductase [Methyloprofundus sp.]